MRTLPGAMGAPTDTLREYSTHKFTVKITDLNIFFLLINIMEIHHEVEEKKPYICIFAYRHRGIAFNAFIF